MILTRSISLGVKRMTSLMGISSLLPMNMNKGGGHFYLGGGGHFNLGATHSKELLDKNLVGV